MSGGCLAIATGRYAKNLSFRDGCFFDETANVKLLSFPRRRFSGDLA
jgi:hypothetical protein